MCDLLTYRYCRSNLEIKSLPLGHIGLVKPSNKRDHWLRPQMSSTRPRIYRLKSYPGCVNQVKFTMRKHACIFSGSNVLMACRVYHLDWYPCLKMMPSNFTHNSDEDTHLSASTVGAITMYIKCKVNLYHWHFLPCEVSKSCARGSC